MQIINKIIFEIYEIKIYLLFLDSFSMLGAYMGTNLEPDPNHDSSPGQHRPPDDFDNDGGRKSYAAL